MINLDQEKEGKVKKRNTFDSTTVLYGGREFILNAFRSGICSIKEKQGKGRLSDLATWLKVLSPKQMLQRLSIALAQVKAGNTSEKFTKWSQTNHIFFVSSKINY